MVYPWRAVDAEGEVLDLLVQSKHAALKRMRKLLRKHGFVPENFRHRRPALLWRRGP
jgi:transposase-like protein